MIRRLSSHVVFGIAALTTGPSAAVAQVISQFNFNDSTTNPSTNIGSGTPAVSLLGGVTATFAAGTGGNGANSTDPAATNNAYNLTNYPAAGGGSGTAGVQFNLPTTAGFDTLVLRFDQRNSGTSNRFFRLEYTTDGSTWTSAGNYTAGGIDAFVTNTFDFSGVTAANNNANFAVRAVSVFGPGGDYAPTNGIGTYAATGTVRYDMVTLSRAIPLASVLSGTPLSATDTVLLPAGNSGTITLPGGGLTTGQAVYQAGAAASYVITGSAADPLTLTAGIANLNAAGTQTFNAPVTFANGATVQNNGTVVFSQPVTMANTANGLQLAGTGTTVLNSTYAGNDISTSTGHTLAGVGTIRNEVHIYGGTIRGGAADGTNNFGTLTLDFNAPGPGSGDLELYTAPGDRAPTIRVEATRTAANAVNHSRIDLRGGSGVDLELNDAGVGANKFRVEVVAANLVVGESYTLTILTTDSTGSIEFNNTPQANGAVLPAASYDLVAGNLEVTNAALTVVDVNNASTLVLTFTPVPEPATVGLVAAGGLAAGWVARRRRVV